MRKIITLLVMAGLLFWQVSAWAGYHLTPRQAFYHHAHKGNVPALQKLVASGYSVNMSDKYGNSALCEAVYRQDYQAYALLRQVGASVAHTCTERIPVQTLNIFNQGYADWAEAVNSGRIPYAGTGLGSFGAMTGTEPYVPMGGKVVYSVPATTGLSTGAKVAIGAGVLALVGGGVALALSGGGGGGSSSSSTSTECSGHGLKNSEGVCQCVGHWTGDACNDCSLGNGAGVNPTTCECKQGYTGDSCETCDTGYKEYNGLCYEDLKCDATHGEQQGSTCVCKDSYVLGTDGKTCYAPISRCQVQTNDTCTTCEGNWAGTTCNDCSLGSGMGVDKDTCTCDSEYTRSGNSCVPKESISCEDTHQYWDGDKCATCARGSAPEPTATACTCPDGWTGLDCSQEQGGDDPEECSGSSDAIAHCFEWTSCQSSGTTLITCTKCDTGYELTLGGMECKLKTTPTCPENSSTSGTGQDTNVSGCKCNAATPKWASSACVGCDADTYWTGTQCVACVHGTSSGGGVTSCICPSGTLWKENNCGTCPSGVGIDQDSCTCTTGYTGASCTDCEDDHVKIGGVCVPKIDCVHGTQVSETSCLCPQDSYWNGDLCNACLVFGEHANTETCTCEEGYTRSGNSCVLKTSIDCPAEDKYWDGNSCSSCTNGSANDPTATSCTCPSGTLWKGDDCGFCPPGVGIDSTTCECKQGYTGESCESCDTGYIKYDGLCYDDLECDATHGEQQGTACTCKDNYVLGTDGKTCYAPISHCQDQTNNTCTTCEAGYDHHGDSNSCYQNIAHCSSQTHDTCSACSGHWKLESNACASCETGYAGADCALCSPDYYLNAGTCTACPEGSSSDGGSVTECTCSGGKTWESGACVESGGGSGGGSGGLDNLPLGFQKNGDSVGNGPSYTNTENITVDPDEMIEGPEASVDEYDILLEDESYNSDNYEKLWMNEHVFEAGAGVGSVIHNPVLYAGHKGSNPLTLTNSGNIKTESVFVWEDDFRTKTETEQEQMTAEELQAYYTQVAAHNGQPYTVHRTLAALLYGTNFENSGTIKGGVMSTSTGADISVANTGTIDSLSLYGLDGKITLSNAQDAEISSAYLEGNVQGTNNGTIGYVELDGYSDETNTGPVLTNTGTINGRVNLYRGTLINGTADKAGLITPEVVDFGSGPVKMDNYIMVYGDSTLTNAAQGTIEDTAIIIHKYYCTNVSKVGDTYTCTSVKQSDQTGGSTRATLTFTNNGTLTNVGIYEVQSDATLLDRTSNYTSVPQVGGSSIIFNNAGNVVFDSALNLANLSGSAGQVTLMEGGFFAAPSIQGDMYVQGDTSGFETTHTLAHALESADLSQLNLVSSSALFDAHLAENGSDVVMQMKDFDTLTSNASLAHFLKENYALQNNESFYNKLKSFGDVKTLTASLDKLTGKEMLSRFNFEDMTMMRELNFDMNDKLFHNKGNHFALAGSVSPMAFKGDTGSNARYSLYNKRDGHKSIGLGIAFTDVRSDDDHESNNRSETMYQLILPIGYKTNGFNLVTSPRIGYARGTYDRTGFDGGNYDGLIEKRVFGLMNEARYPIALGKWQLEPSAEFNILGYQQKGHEEGKDFALNIQSQKTVSVEAGVGLYVTREEQWDQQTKLKLNAGIAAYHEFADPYRVKVGMSGMAGAFTLYDENRSANRGVIRAGFDYAYRDVSLYGSLISYIDKEARTSAKTGFKWKF